jgi:hypothetical protein
VQFTNSAGEQHADLCCRDIHSLRRTLGHIPLTKENHVGRGVREAQQRQLYGMEAMEIFCGTKPARVLFIE